MEAPPTIDLKDAGKAQQAERDRPRIIAEWQTGIRNLFDDIRGWLRQEEVSGLVTFTERDSQKTEPWMGTYTVPILTILTGRSAITVEPIRRIAPAATGRVEMKPTRGHPGPPAVMLRAVSPDGLADAWRIAVPSKPIMVQRRPASAAPPTYQLLTKEIFGDALERLIVDAR